MAGNSLGTSYVQVVPKFKGGSLDAMGQQAGQAFEGGLGSALKKVAGIIATSAIIKGIYDIGKAAVSSYADFEQLVGGVETLYKENADELIANAQRAYMTAGVSANEYMEMSTSFAAALVNSLGGDTAEAARLADVAITDMSDNANKMGTDMAAIQNAYQGFAKQNYTMLDNLKLGYGGTRGEMERLLADAEAISGIHYDIENYSDVVSAIHVIQEEMGIAGTTAEEAAATISGSWGMLKASWGNLLVSLAGGGADIETAVHQVFESLATWLGNIVPRIGETVHGIFAALPAAAKEMFPVVRDGFLGLIRETFGSDATDIVLDFVNTLHGMLGRIGELFEPFGEFASGEGAAFAGMMERIRGHLADLQTVVSAELIPAINNMIEAARPIIEAVVPVIIDLVGNLASALVGLVPIIAETIASAADIITGLLNTVTSVWNGIKETTSSVFGAVKDTAISIWNGIKSAIEDPIGTARDFVKNAIDRIRGFFNFEFKWPHIPLPHFSISGSINPLDWLSGGLPSISVSWYGHGGFVDGATLIGAGERGGELIWPSYEPELSRYADAIARSGGAGTVNNYYIDGSLVAADAQLAAALDVVAQRVGGRRRMGTVR